MTGFAPLTSRGSKQYRALTLLILPFCVVFPFCTGVGSRGSFGVEVEGFDGCRVWGEESWDRGGVRGEH